ncbi:MAG: methyltransferase domain-containing protein [Chloroflexi bacterium]|nr:methyltransferase domain-containing protein [Chloroflexota bacterium]
MQQPTPEQAKLMMAGIFNRAAPTYGQVGPGYFDYFGQRLVAQAGLKPGMRVLDVATGRGAVLFPAAQAVGPSGSVIGIDLAEEMVHATNAEIERRRLLNASAEVLDADDLTFPEASFDAITCAFSVFFLSDRDAALREFYRLLRAGGQLAVSIWGEETRSEVTRWRWYDELVRRFLPSSSGSSPLNPGREMDTPGQLAARLAAAAFADISLQSETKAFAYASPEDWWQERWSLFFRTALERLAPEALADLQTEALSNARTMQFRGELLTERNAVYVVARKCPA